MGEGIADGRLLCLSTFSGVGGLDLGLERSGFSIIGAVENDAAARRSLALNRPRLPFLEPHDIDEVAQGLVPRDLGIEKGDLALLAAGPPCQPFSKAAQWARTGALGLNDDRTNCLNGLLALIERFLPHAVLIENVPGFVTGGSSTLPFLEKRLAELNRRSGTRYTVSHRMLDAAELGVPQRRRRAIVVALRRGGEPEWPEVTHGDRPVRAWDALRCLRPATAPAPRGQFAGLLPSVPEGMNYQYFTERGEGPSLFGYRRRFWSFLLKLAKAEPALDGAGESRPGHGSLSLGESTPCAGGDPAIAELSELLEARRQLPRAGPASGQCHSPLLAELLGRSIAKQLFGVDFRGPPTLAITRSARVPPPTPPQPVADEYMLRAGEHPPHPGPGCGPSPRPAQSMGSQREEEGQGSALVDAKAPA